jgi:hypothetical protein
LFVVRSREELYEALCTKLTPPPRVRFAGGMYSELLAQTPAAATAATDSLGGTALGVPPGAGDT